MHRPPPVSASRHPLLPLLGLVAAALAAGGAAPSSLAAQAAGPAGVAAADTSWAAVDRAIGRAGAPQPGGVRKYGFPRADLHVTVGGVALRPALALGSWVAFARTGAGADSAMAMGDLVLREGEVAPVLAKLEQMGVEATALHNHLQGESPRVMYLHVAARGAPVRIAEAVRAALALTGTPPAPSAGAAGAGPALAGLDTAALARALGYAGKATGGVYQVSVPRADTVTVNGMPVPPAMGVATALNFQPAGAGKAAATGDFVLAAAEVNPVLRALHAHGIAVTAVHSHMLDEQPRLFFMHFWAVDDAARLGRGLRAALAQMKVRPPAS